MDTPPPQARSLPERYWRPIALSAAVVMAALSAIVYLFVTGTSHPAASRAHPAAAAAPAAPARAAALAPPLSPQAKGRVAGWKASRGGTALAHVSGQLGVASMAGGVGHFAAMRLACVQLAAAVTAARAQPPIPDAALQKWYRAALSELAKAAAHCQAAISFKPNGDEDIATDHNATLLNLARSEFAAGAKDLYRATASIRTGS
jgi:hypothetical protein